MKQIVGAFRRTSFGTVAALFLLTVVGVALPAREASAAGLLYRSLQLSSSANSVVGTPTTAGGEEALPGTAANGNEVSHTYIFQVRTGGTIKGLGISYCNTAFGYLEMGAGESCELGDNTKIPGFDASNAPSAKFYISTGGDFVNTPLTWPNASSPNATFAVVGGSTDVNQVTVADATGLTVTAGQFIKVQFDADASNSFSNPNSSYTDANGLQTFFAHLTTYNSESTFTTGTSVDEGTVTNAATNTVEINTRVQETLKFAVDSDASNVPNAEGTACDNLTGTGNGNLTMGDAANNALSTSRSYDAKSFFRLATNSSKGANVLYAGQTLTSTAGDTIPAIGTSATASTHGTEQFGLAIATDASGNTVLGSNTEGLVPEAPYNGGLDGDTASDANGTYAFDATSDTSPKLIASSEGVVACNTAVVRYIGNISNETPAGLYSTKISYIAVPSY